MRYAEFSPLQRGILACSFAEDLASKWPALRATSYAAMGEALAAADPVCSIDNEAGPVIEMEEQLAGILRDRARDLFPDLYAPDWYEANPGQSIPVPEWMIEDEAHQTLVDALDLSTWTETQGTGQLVLVCDCGQVKGSLGGKCRACGSTITARLP